MDFIFQFQLSIYALVALVMLTARIYYIEEVYSYSSRLFRMLLLMSGFIMILELLSWMFDGVPGEFNYVLNYLFNFLLFIFSTVVASFWLSYIHYKIYGDIKKIRKHLWFLYPMFLSVIIAIINMFYPIVFQIPTDTNIYERLPFVSFNFALVYILIGISLYLAIKERARIKPVILIVVILFIMIPALASLLQLFQYGLIIMYPSMTLSLIVIYLFMETPSTSMDYLTGAHSRSRLDEYIDRKIIQNEEFCVIMLDLDDFKLFNDQYGHVTGDRILIQFVNYAKQIFGAQALVSRYGGDEFVVVVSSTETAQLLGYRDALRTLIEASKDTVFQSVKFSFGHACRTVENQFTYDQLLVSCDKDMYRDKAINKNFKRRKEDRTKDFMRGTGE